MIWREWLAEQAARRESDGLRRRLRPRAADDDALDLAGNDYLGLARHPAVVAAAAAAARRWGAGAGASRLVTGSLDLHAELEAALASFLGQPAALVMSTGYHANLSAVAALADRDCLVVSDAHVHASLVDAVRLSAVPRSRSSRTTTSRPCPAALGRGAGGRALVVVESVYSVLGDAAPLAELAALCAAYDALLVVDEAHGLGVAGAGGRGLRPRTRARRARPRHRHRDAVQGAGRQGGAVLGSAAVVEHLVNRARPFIYDTGLAPAAAGGALAALRLLAANRSDPPWCGERVRALAAALGVEAAGRRRAVGADAVAAGGAAGPGGALGRGCVGCFRPPSVPDGISRLRITTSAGIADADWARAIAVLRQVVKEYDARAPDEPRRRRDRHRHRRRQDGRHRRAGRPGGGRRIGRRGEAGADRRRVARRRGRRGGPPAHRLCRPGVHHPRRPARARHGRPAARRAHPAGRGVRRPRSRCWRSPTTRSSSRARAACWSAWTPTAARCSTSPTRWRPTVVVVVVAPGSAR